MRFTFFNPAKSPKVVTGAHAVVTEAKRQFSRTLPLTKTPDTDTDSAMAAVMTGKAYIGQFGIFQTRIHTLAATREDGAVLLARKPANYGEGDLFVHEGCPSAESFKNGY